MIIHELTIKNGQHSLRKLMKIRHGLKEFSL